MAFSLYKIFRLPSAINKIGFLNQNFAEKPSVFIQNNKYHKQIPKAPVKRVSNNPNNAQGCGNLKRLCYGGRFKNFCKSVKANPWRRPDPPKIIEQLPSLVPNKNHCKMSPNAMVCHKVKFRCKCKVSK